MQVTLRLYATELLGTFLIVLFGAGTVCASHLTLDGRLNTTGLPIGLDVTGIALAEGLMLGALLALFGPGATAGFNPAITLALYIRQKFDLKSAVGLIAVQIVGALLGGLVVRLLFTDSILQAASAGTPHLFAFRGEGDQITVAALTSGALLEFLFTAVLAFFFSWWMLDPNSPRLAGLIVGLVMVAIILFGYRLTGGAANPARWLGPVVWEASLAPTGSVFADHPVYWAGPIAGALVGTVVAGALLPASEGGKRR